MCETIKCCCFTGIRADEDKTIQPQGMEPVDTDKRFYQTDRTDREMAIQDIIRNWTNHYTLSVSKSSDNLFSTTNIILSEHTHY